MCVLVVYFIICGRKVLNTRTAMPARSSGLHLESLHVIGLPAVHGEMEALHLREHLLRVHSDSGIAFACD